MSSSTKSPFKHLIEMINGLENRSKEIHREKLDIDESLYNLRKLAEESGIIIPSEAS